MCEGADAGEATHASALLRLGIFLLKVLLVTISDNESIALGSSTWKYRIGVPQLLNP